MTVILQKTKLTKGSPLSLGYDKWTNNYYSNKDLIINSIHYLVNNNERLLLRDKNLKVNTLDKIKIKKYASLLEVVYANNSFIDWTTKWFCYTIFKIQK